MLHLETCSWLAALIKTRLVGPRPNAIKLFYRWEELVDR